MNRKSITAATAGGAADAAAGRRPPPRAAPVAVPCLGDPARVRLAVDEAERVAVGQVEVQQLERVRVGEQGQPLARAVSGP